MIIIDRSRLSCMAWSKNSLFVSHNFPIDENVFNGEGQTIKLAAVIAWCIGDKWLKRKLGYLATKIGYKR